MRRGSRKFVVVVGVACLVTAYILSRVASSVGTAVPGGPVVVAVLVAVVVGAIVGAVVAPHIADRVRVNRPHRPPSDGCPKCGYPRRSIPSGPVVIDGIHVDRSVCPECGFVELFPKQ